MLSVSLLGVPNDDNSSYLRGPAEAPAAIRRELHSDAHTDWSETGIAVGEAGRIVDRGDVDFDGSADPWDLIERRANEVMANGTRAIFLGGDHAVTHPLLKSARRRHPKLTLVHIDAHPDIYDAYQGNRRSHASPFARIMEEGLVERLVQIGLRTINDHHRSQFERFGVEVIEARAMPLKFRLNAATPVYLSVDIDALDPAFAPGVSHREPGGLTTRQVIDIIHAIDAPLVAADIVEYNPRCDLVNMTALVAAKLVKEVAGVMLRSTDNFAVSS